MGGPHSPVTNAALELVEHADKQLNDPNLTDDGRKEIKCLCTSMLMNPKLRRILAMHLNLVISECCNATDARQFVDRALEIYRHAVDGLRQGERMDAEELKSFAALKVWANSRGEAIRESAVRESGIKQEDLDTKDWEHCKSPPY